MVKVQELDLDAWEVVELDVPSPSFPPPFHYVAEAGFTPTLDTPVKKKKKKKKEPVGKASLSETFAFVFECGPKVTTLFAIGVTAGFLNGMVYPVLAYLFSSSMSDLSSASLNGIVTINEIALLFVYVGIGALVAGGAQNWSFEIVAYHGSQNFRLKYFQALLRQDQAFYDVYDVGGIASQVESNANKFRRGTGRKFAEFIEFSTTGVGGLAYAFYSNWRVALVILALLPIASLTAMFLIYLNQAKGTLTVKNYQKAGSVAYSAVASVKTVLSLNAVQQMVDLYKEATKLAYQESVKFILKLGLANGSMLGSFLLLYFVLTLYGTSLLFKEVLTDGCDPSGGVPNNASCPTTGAEVFGAMLGVAFAAQGMSQVGNTTEALGEARVAVYEALIAINRRPGSPEKVIYKSVADSDEIGTTGHSKASKQTRDEASADEQEIKAILPEFRIDSSSKKGLKPAIQGQVSFRNVSFHYPTRPGDTVLDGISFDVAAGETVALVGPSGSGKSSTVLLLERFYDPTGGQILLDGVNLNEINVGHLRSSIGYVGQEPALFATSIRGNILYGNPDATQKQIEEAAKLANAHSFICALPDGYDTQVGDAGSMLSGGQKQRISLARVLVGEPKILLLDEATSALDAESELVVQDALDSILEAKKITTIVIAHRLSTIRNADKINVIMSGRVSETGTHDELMNADSYYRRLVEKQEGVDKSEAEALSRVSSAVNLSEHGGVDHTSEATASDLTPIVEFRDVGFSYPSRPHKKVLDGFSLKVQQGETVALVGPSGGGKSTTVGLIERFYDVNAGEVLYFGNDVRSLNVSWYRKQLAYVGQEPTLFNMTIAENIAFGAEGVSRADIIQAARQANAYDFIVEFPEGFETLVGASKSNTGLSGGQKQRIAIARALVRKPRVLILDEATSALDSESEAVVQEAIHNLMQSRGQTVIVIAHRLSTIRDADRIALVAEGKVLEFGSHDELVVKPNGRYKRLFESSKRQSTVESVGLKKGTDQNLSEGNEEEKEINWESKIAEEEKAAFSAARARQMAKPDTAYLLIGSIGAVVSGGVFPAWGILFSQTILLLFNPVFDCPDADGLIPFAFETCDDYWSSAAYDMRQQSFIVAAYWIGLLFAFIIGTMVQFYGFGTASERLNKRLRDSTFSALLRQEVAFFDKRSVGAITSQLQEDAARIHAFSGEPIRTVISALGSLLVGIIISFIYMWPLALVTLGCIPIMGFATAYRMKQMTGEEDEKKTDKIDELNSPSGIVVETLLNMRTVSALVLESRRYQNYEEALRHSEPNYRRDAFVTGMTGGIALFLQQWVNALQLWFGGWLMINRGYDFNDFLIAMFCILFSLFGLGSAFTNVSDRAEVEKSAGRVFYLLDRHSEIDPVAKSGTKLV